MLVIIVSGIVCVKLKSPLLLSIILVLECRIAIFADKYTVKQYSLFLLGKQHHLEETVSFLKTTLPGNNLFNADQIEELTVRLTKRIEAKKPFKNFLNISSNFTKIVILPVVTYVAGVYSGDLKQLDFETVAVLAMSVMLFLGIGCVACSGILVILRTMICKDRDAAIALREDLMDIKLLYFSNNLR